MEKITTRQQEVDRIKKSSLSGQELITAIKEAMHLPVDPDYVPELSEKQKRAKAILTAKDWMIANFKTLTLEKKIYARDRYIVLVENFIKDYQDEPEGVSTHIANWEEDIETEKWKQDIDNTRQ